jgi:hypothetical protein
LQVEDDLALVGQFLRLADFEVFGQVDVELEVVGVGGFDVVGEIFGGLGGEEVGEGQFEGLVFGGNDILFDNTDDFPEGIEVDERMSVLNEVVEEVVKVVMEAFAVGSNELLELLVDAGRRDEGAIDGEGERVNLKLVLLHDRVDLDI